MNMIDSMTRRFHRSRAPIVRVPIINTHPQPRQQPQQPQPQPQPQPRPQPQPHKQSIMNECPICMETIDTKSDVIITKCNHQFCATCLLREMNNRNTCPVCRRILKPEYNEKYNLSNNELRDIVVRNLAFMPQDHLKIVDNILPILNAVKIPELFEENANLMETLEQMEADLLTTMSMFGYYIATDIRDIILDDET
jgi:hypothetical protein